MTAPPAVRPDTTATAPTSGPNGEQQSRSDQFLSPRIVAREAVKILAARGIEVRPAAIRKLVTRFIREGHTTTDHLEQFLLPYADPTAKAAIRNVMRGPRS